MEFVFAVDIIIIAYSYIAINWMEILRKKRFTVNVCVSVCVCVHVGGLVFIVSFNYTIHKAMEKVNFCQRRIFR